MHRMQSDHVRLDVISLLILVIILIIVGAIKPLGMFSCLFYFSRVPYYQGHLVLVKPF